MPYDLHSPPTSPVLPTGYVVVWNRISKSNRPHILDCGCLLQKGCHYHSLGVKAFGQLLYHKRHVWACPKDSGSPLITRH